MTFESVHNSLQICLAPIFRIPYIKLKYPYKTKANKTWHCSNLKVKS